MDGLSEILRQKYDPDYKDEAKKEALMKASELKAKSLLAKKGKGKLNVSDLMM